MKINATIFEWNLWMIMDYTCTCTEHVRLASGLTATAFPFFCGQGLKLRSIDPEDIMPLYMTEVIFVSFL